MSKTKVFRPKAETPKGFRDYFGAEVTARKAMLDRIATVYHRYGFDPLETSAVETVEALGKFLPDVDRPNEGVFAWQEEDQNWLALRYDLTAPLARVAAQYRNDLPAPYRRYAMGPVWRNEKPGPGRFRQFYQCDADTVGASTVAADAEICAMLADVFEDLGLGGDFVVRINNRKVLNGVMEAAGVLDPADPSKFEAERGIVLRAIDKLDRLGEDGVRALLGAGRGAHPRARAARVEVVRRVHRAHRAPTGLRGAVARRGRRVLATVPVRGELVAAARVGLAKIRVGGTAGRGAGHGSEGSPKGWDWRDGKADNPNDIIELNYEYWRTESASYRAKRVL